MDALMDPWIENHFAKLGRLVLGWKVVVFGAERARRGVRFAGDANGIGGGPQPKSKRPHIPQATSTRCQWRDRGEDEPRQLAGHSLVLERNWLVLDLDV